MIVYICPKCGKEIGTPPNSIIYCPCKDPKGKTTKMEEK